MFSFTLLQKLIFFLICVIENFENACCSPTPFLGFLSVFAGDVFALMNPMQQNDEK
jgi:hypothetical protein